MGMILWGYIRSCGFFLGCYCENYVAVVDEFRVLFASCADVLC